MMTGHRADVCPRTPNTRKCRTCGIANPIENHPCTPKCALCKESHVTGAKECRQNLRKARIPPGNERRKQLGPRWFSSDSPTTEEAAGTG
ncbi:hypothetical protein HPB48_002789 [Haemaphysalis longicornis]|uniref:Uncharacterized protein n=1 Tax=Haemaphysalis longicornis TaxID=44386 RepID=A0A9J6GQE4_HAELO|nr:hypothetical protein HPB48_002789 [Haemaphysalis longicornis]